MIIDFIFQQFHLAEACAVALVWRLPIIFVLLVGEAVKNHHWYLFEILLFFFFSHFSGNEIRSWEWDGALKNIYSLYIFNIHGRRKNDEKHVVDTGFGVNFWKYS